MVIAILVVVGLALGSFINALVWRHREQSKTHKSKSIGKKSKLQAEASTLQDAQKRYSIINGRSMCPECRHELAARDLVPVLSWLRLRGKCRYCHQGISWQYPIVEVANTILFIVSYLYWPQELAGVQWVSFGLWLAILVGLVALVVYDIRWQLLPNKIVFTLGALALVRAIVLAASDKRPLHQAVLIFFGALVGGGIFYVLFQLSAGKWIGGGDAKLGFVLGLVVGRPDYAFLLIFLASLIGTLIAVPPLLAKKTSSTTRIPFGPFLITGCYIALLGGKAIVGWYTQTFYIMPH